jgi:hypothetical protein
MERYGFAVFHIRNKHQNRNGLGIRINPRGEEEKTVLYYLLYK